MKRKLFNAFFNILNLLAICMMGAYVWVVVTNFSKLSFFDILFYGSILNIFILLLILVEDRWLEKIPKYDKRRFADFVCYNGERGDEEVRK